MEAWASEDVGDDGRPCIDSGSSNMIGRVPGQGSDWDASILGTTYSSCRSTLAGGEGGGGPMLKLGSSMLSSMLLFCTAGVSELPSL